MNIVNSVIRLPIEMCAFNKYIKTIDNSISINYRSLKYRRSKRNRNDTNVIGFETF